MDITIKPILDFITDCYNILWTTAQSTVAVLSTSLQDLWGFSIPIPIIQDLMTYPLGSLLLGAGFLVFVVWTVIKWFL